MMSLTGKVFVLITMVCDVPGLKKSTSTTQNTAEVQNFFTVQNFFVKATMQSKKSSKTFATKIKISRFPSRVLPENTVVATEKQ